jgi:hypothetical protein
MHSSERVGVVQKEEKDQILYYGSRKSCKLVRCYQKGSLGVFRVELELHSGLLHDISDLDDFLYLPDIVFPKHFQSVALDWSRLEQYLSRRLGDESDRIIAGARRRAPSLRKYGAISTKMEWSTFTGSSFL